MKLAQMLSYWHLKGMISETKIVSEHTELSTRINHAIVSVRVQCDHNTHAIVLYRQENFGDCNDSQQHLSFRYCFYNHS